MSTTATSAKIWETLSSTYAKASHCHIRQLKKQLRQWTKGTNTIYEYFQGLMSLIDQFALLGKLEDHKGKIEYVLQGFSDDCKTVINQIECHDVSLSLTEVHEELINHELKLAMKTNSPSCLPITANVANFCGNKKNLV